MQDHNFYLTLAYGAGALLLVLELAFLVQRCRRISKLEKSSQP